MGVEDSQRKKILRMVDANFNRAKEALRVVEDLCRFFLEEPSLTAKFKQCRHGLTRALLKFPIPYKALAASRNSRDDVGKNHGIQDRRRRPDWKDVMLANLKRSEEALRVLEEASKLVAPGRSRSFEKLRFKIYELEKESLRKF